MGDETLEYILYCDESSEKGKKVGDFYGGCLVDGHSINRLNAALNDRKRELNLTGEVKWTKVTENYLEKYKALMTTFFDFVRSGDIKVRIMFRYMEDMPSVPGNADEKYFKLYYQFIKHGFGFLYAGFQNPTYIRIYLDQLPDKKEKCETFKNYLLAMQRSRDFLHSNIVIRSDDIAEVKSHDHVLLQCVDVILGAMYFRLNELHKEIPQGQKRRGKRTVAKEKLYKHIHAEICTVFDRFNIGMTTGRRNQENPSWDAPYSHWRFMPR